MRTLGPNRIPIHRQDDAVFAFLGLERVPFPVTESCGGSGLIGGCNPAGTIVDVKQDLNNANTWVSLSTFRTTVFLTAS